MKTTEEIGKEIFKETLLKEVKNENNRRHI